MGDNTGPVSSTISISQAELLSRPKFAVTDNFLFYTFIDEAGYQLRFSTDGGKSFSGLTKLCNLEGEVLDLRISAKNDIALVTSIEQNNDGTKVRAVVGIVIEVNEGLIFQPRECQGISLQVPPDSILDITSQINADGTSDDCVFIRAGTGATTTVFGHHPHPQVQ